MDTQQETDIFGDFLTRKCFKICRYKDGTACVRDSQSKLVPLERLYKQYMDAHQLLPGWTFMSEESIRGYLEDHLPEDANDEEKRTPPSLFVNGWINSHADKWYVSPLGKKITLKEYGIPVDKDFEDLCNRILVDVYDDRKPYREGEITRCLQNWFMNRYQFGVYQIFDQIKYEPEYADKHEKWLHAFYDYVKPVESFEIFSAIMNHWGANVKNKLLGNKVKHHMWPNFYGATGLGKTTLLTQTCSPLSDVTSITTIAKLFDDTREIKRLTENYILIFDELAINGENDDGEKLGADQQATLKAILTGEDLDTRVFKTQNQSKKRITFMCISSANYHLYDIIYDPTSMRRFFEFHCQAEATGDYSGAQVIMDNPLWFWKGIDEKKEYFNPKSIIGQQVTKMQKAYYPTTSSVFDWIQNTSAHAGSKPAHVAYRAYTQYCKNCGRKAKALNNFVDDVKHAIPDAIVGGTVTIDFTMTDLCKVYKGYDNDSIIDEIGLKSTPISNTDLLVEK